MPWALVGMVVVWAAAIGYVLHRVKRSHATRKVALRRQTEMTRAVLDDLKRTTDDLSDTVGDHTHPPKQQERS